MKKLFALALFLALVTGCGQPKLDCSSPSAYDASLERIRESVTPEERNLISDSIVLASIGEAIDAKTAPAPHEAAKRFNGMTGRQIIEAMKDELQDANDASNNRQ